MSGRDVLRRAAVAVLLLGVAGLVVTGLRLTDFDAGTVQGAAKGSVQGAAQNSVAVAPRPVVAAAHTGTTRGATLVPPASTEENLAVRELLVTRAAAVMSGDRKSWAITTPYDQGPQTRKQLALFDRLVALQPVSWAYTGQRVSVPVGESGAPGERRLAVSLQLRYSLVDGGPTITRDQTMTVTGKGGRWWVSDLSAPGSDETAAATGQAATGQAATGQAATGRTAMGQTSAAVDLWDLTPVLRVQGDRCLVIGSPKRKAWVRWFATHCGAASATVDAAVPGAVSRPVRTLLVVPADVKQLARLLGRTDTAGLERTAAVTIGPVRAPAEAVLMNADAFAQLRGVGRRVVLTHELVHVATRADQTADVPIWLEEGLADEIAYRGTGLDAATIAGPVIRAAKAGRFPDSFPTAEDFDASVPDSGTGGPSLAYARAWSAADTIAEEDGLAKLVQLHHLVATGTSLDAAFQQVLGMDAAAFIAVWHKHLQALAR